MKNTMENEKRELKTEIGLLERLTVDSAMEAELRQRWKKRRLWTAARHYLCAGAVTAVVTVGVVLLIPERRTEVPMIQTTGAVAKAKEVAECGYECATAKVFNAVYGKCRGGQVINNQIINNK